MARINADGRNFHKIERSGKAVKGANMKTIFAAVVLCISLCGCAAQNDRGIHRNLVGPTVIGDSKSVLVSHAQSEADARRLAEKHCKRFGKSARFNRMEGVRVFFDCQSPS
jgi:predicted naringenin-chalcone synthase